MELVLKRRAVYTGLRPYLNDHDVIDALKLWEVEYSDKSSVALTGFITVICHKDELKRKRTRILTSLLKAMELKEGELLADPYDTIIGAYKLVAGEQLSVDNKTGVFARFFETLAEKLNEKDAMRMRAYVIQAAGKLDLSPLNHKRLCDWVDKKTKTLSGQYDVNILRDIISSSYVSMCQLEGPVKTDQLLSQAIAEVEAFADSKQVNLHDFL